MSATAEIRMAGPRELFRSLGFIAAVVTIVSVIENGDHTQDPSQFRKIAFLRLRFLSKEFN